MCLAHPWIINFPVVVGQGEERGETNPIMEFCLKSTVLKQNKHRRTTLDITSSLNFILPTAALRPPCVIAAETAEISVRTLNPKIPSRRGIGTIQQLGVLPRPWGIASRSSREPLQVGLSP